MYHKERQVRHTCTSNCLGVWVYVCVGVGVDIDIEVYIDADVCV